jgi:HK97 family phage portal protein
VTQKTAMAIATYFACVNAISSDLTKLPKHVRQKQGRGSVALPDHPVQMLLNRPNSYTDRHTFWLTIFSHAVSGPGGYAEIVYGPDGQPESLHLIHPDQVRVEQLDDASIWYHVSGTQHYAVIPASYMLHFKGLGYDAVTGYDMSVLGRQVLGAAMALQKYRGAFFGNGANPSGILKHPRLLDENAVKRLREQFEARYHGGQSAHKTMLLEDGLEYQQVSIDPDRAKMVELANATAEEICRYFRMPQHKVGLMGAATFSNIEEQNIEYYTDTIDSWRDCTKSEMEFKLFGPRDVAAGNYIDISLKGALRGSTAQRVSYYKERFYMGTLSPNDIRELEDETPIEDPNADEYWFQQNMAPLSKAGAIFDQQAAPAPVEAPEPEPTEEEAEDTRGRIVESYRMILENRIQKNILRVEADKAKRDKAHDHFYESHERYVCEQLIPTIEAVGVGLGIEIDAKHIAASYAHLHTGVSQSNIKSNALESWENGNRAKAAANMILAAIQKAANEVKT